MKRLVIMGMCTLLAACATLGNPQTTQQKLYEALGTYNVAVEAAADYAESPGANKAVVKALNSVINSTEATAALDVAEGYVRCDTGLQTTGCEVYTGTVLQRATAILKSLKAQLTKAGKVTT